MLHLNHLFLLFVSIGPCFTYGNIKIETKKRWIRLPIPIPRPPAVVPVTPNVCPTVTMGCTAAGGGTCDATTMMCTVPDTTPTNCHWPATTTGCTADTTQNPQLGNCACAGSTPVVPNVCATVTNGCTATGGGTCDATSMMCTTPDTTPTNCHWPATTTGCTADTANNPLLGDCACAGSAG